GQTVQSGINGISYYGGTPVGAAAIFGGEFECSVQFVSLFGVGDVENYSSFAPVECPLCKRGVRVDAVVNSYGYSKIL
ncbi:MAG: orotate phosphoribosyltransferase, partial [Clostridia bacterium]|nr:orotate phosphoribosyltransferase [Clostridia bacterium]